MRIKNKPDKEQLKAIKFGDGPLLIIAGAGTGKTTVITERIKYLILKKHIDPSEILALTFTEKASSEMGERVDKVMPYGYTQMWISTFHSFCDRILKQEAIHIGLNPGYKLLTEAESLLLLKQNLFKFNLNYFRPLGNPNKFLISLLQHFSRLKDEDVSTKDYLEYAQNFLKKSEDLEKLSLEEKRLEKEKALELSQAFKTYEEIKVKEGVMDFSDLISNTLKLFRARKNILKNYHNQFTYILVDEFQDTNYSQNELAILLSGDRQNINVVGDDDQSIYRFRGSSVSNIIQFKKRFPNAKVITLVKNYRSTKEILDKSYALIQHNNPDRLEIKEKVNKKLISARNISGDKIEFIFADRVENEAEQVAKTILKLISAMENKYDFKDIAILVRANDHSQSFIRSFERMGIPFQFLGPGKLFQREEIKDLIAYLKVLCNYEDSASLYRVLNIPVFNFESIEIAALLNLAKRKNYSLFEAMEKTDEIILKEDSQKKIKNIVKMIKRHLGLISKDSAGQILYYFLENTGFLKKLVDAKNEKEELAAKNIARFFDKLKTYEVDHESSSVFSVVDWIDLSMQMGESPLSANTDWSENNAVNILSIHSSKGLEFPVVFLVNLVSQRFPTRERKETIPIPIEFIKEILPTGDFHLQEERRLFYVGMTRAKDQLFMSAANFYGESKREKKISPFVYEALGEKFVEKNIRQLKQKNSVDQLSLLDWAPLNFPKSKTKKNNQTAISYLSYSQIQTFEICPLHYKLKYILKIPTPVSSAQSFGTSVHATLRDYYQSWKRGEKIEQKLLLNLLEKNWINEGYFSKDHEKKALLKAQNILTDYIKLNFNKKNLPSALEYSFNFFVSGIKIGGRMDRIDQIGNDIIEIIDYKTGGNVPTEKDLAKDKQLTLYALAATEVRDKILNKKPENILLSLHYLEKNIKLTTVRTKSQLEEAKEWILQKAAEIEKSDFACSRSVICANCEFKILCQS